MSDTLIEQQFDAYSNWRNQLHNAISEYRNWVREQKLCDIQNEQRIDQVLANIQDDKLHVAFVAEFSRGKSELINAVFFGGLGRRVLPSAAGRTTMCPTELKYNAAEATSIRLLPIETRSSGTTIAEYKSIPEEWEDFPFDPNDANDVANTLLAVTDVKEVTVEQARALGLPLVDDYVHEDGIQIKEDGLVEIPRWRHAMINYPHPMLEQGLVILDTPGLNALGAEPELTLSMLASAHAVMFILAADAGVTKSDMALWRDHISSRESDSHKGKLVVLNKIDVLWDELRDRREVNEEIERQIESTADTLALPRYCIFPVSAQKALLGKIRDDDKLIRSSGIVNLEEALAQMLIPAKLDIVRDSVRSEMNEIMKSIRVVVSQRLTDVNEHIQELENLNSKNVEVIEDMMDKVSADKEHLEKNLQRFQATRAIFTQQTNRLYNHLSLVHLDRLIAQTKKDMSISLTTAGLRSGMIKFFSTVTKTMETAANQAKEVQDLMEGVYKKFQEEHGLANIKPRRFSTAKHSRELKRLEERHEYFVRGLSMVMTEQEVLIRKFYESVVSKVKQVFERANRDADSWLKTIMSPMESQVREHQIQLRRRLESIKRIHKASDTLGDRLAELHHVRDGMDNQFNMLKSLEKKMEQRQDSVPAPKSVEDARYSA